MGEVKKPDESEIGNKGKPETPDPILAEIANMEVNVPENKDVFEGKAFSKEGLLNRNFGKKGEKMKIQPKETAQAEGKGETLFVDRTHSNELHEKQAHEVVQNSGEPKGIIVDRVKIRELREKQVREGLERATAEGKKAGEPKGIIDRTKMHK